MLNKSEEKILKYLGLTGKEFEKLGKQHQDEQNDFTDGIRRCQYIIGARLVRKLSPKTFTER